MPETGTIMTIRTTRTTVTFKHPFALRGYDGVLPAGDYRVLTDEELIDGLSFLAYRRVATLIFPLAVLPELAGNVRDRTRGPCRRASARSRSVGVSDRAEQVQDQGRTHRGRRRQPDGLIARPAIPQKMQKISGSFARMRPF